VERRQSSAPTAYPAGSIGDLIARYRTVMNLPGCPTGTQTNYEVIDAPFEAHDTWAWCRSETAPLAVQTRANAMKETAVMANQMLSVGAPMGLGHSAGLAVVNPFDKVRTSTFRTAACAVASLGCRPRPRSHAWPDLVRKW